MKHFAVSILAIVLTGCGPTWPNDRFPAELEVDRTLFAEGGLGFVDTCVAMVVEVTDKSAVRLIGPGKRVKGAWVASPPDGWLPTPMPTETGQPTFYRGAFTGCNNEGRKPLGDLPGALQRPGAYYKVLDHGQGIGVILPRQKLAGFYYFG